MGSKFLNFIQLIKFIDHNIETKGPNGQKQKNAKYERQLKRFFITGCKTKTLSPTIEDKCF